VRGVSDGAADSGARGGSRRSQEVGRESPGPADSHLRVLEGICRAFASASNPEEAQVATARWVREAAGQDATLRIRLLEDNGELRVIFSDRRLANEVLDPFSGSLEAIRTKRPVMEAGPSSDSSIASIPLISRGETVGVLEVMAPRESLTEAMASLEAVASQAAIVFRNLRSGAEPGRADAGPSPILLARQLISARSPEEAVRVAVAFCSEGESAPSAGWHSSKDTMLMSLVAIEGFGPVTAQDVRHRMASIPRWDLLSLSERMGILADFRALSGMEESIPIDAGEALVLTSVQPHDRLSVVHDLLRGVLDQLATVAQADQRTKQLDLALAWTAHEFRGPLSGVKALLEQELDSQESDARSTMKRLHTEVVRLLEIVDPVLDSAIGPDQLQLRSSDLVDLVEEAASALDHDAAGGRVRISGSRPAAASVDRALIRVAISNLIRNAVAYSSPDTEVRVSVKAVGGQAQVKVSNEGPAIPMSEREIIFDPFIRGRSGRSFPGGRGLGLFIVRRIVEAHRGRLWVESSDGQRTVFALAVPLVDVDVVNLVESDSRVLLSRQL
jgi:signal transduction histidine kinase